MNKIWFDITHPAQLNFYLNSIKILSENCVVYVSVLNRGKLVSIAKKELSGISNCELLVIGKHGGSKFSAIYEANFLRFISLIRIIYKNQPLVTVGNGFLHCVASSFLGKPSIAFNDDLERKLSVLLMKTFSTELYHISEDPNSEKKDGVSIFHSLKEWAYLSPDYFHPNESILNEYDLEKGKYIFVREVITGTLNYKGQTQNLISSISSQFPNGVTVVLSLEDKSTYNEYPNSWVLLKEPLADIHSLIYFSKLLLSSGDSMAREGAVLGVPSIYCGIREMVANRMMIDRKMLYFISIDKVPGIIKKLYEQNSIGLQKGLRNSLNEEWVDVTQLIISRVKNYLKQL